MRFCSQQQDQKTGLENLLAVATDMPGKGLHIRPTKTQQTVMFLYSVLQ